MNKNNESMKTASTEAEFEELLKEGKMFQLEPTAGITIISIDPEKPPMVQITGEFNILCKMLSYGMSELISKEIKDTGDTAGIVGHFKRVSAAAIGAALMEADPEYVAKVTKGE